MTHFDTGFRLSILGDNCFITRIRPQTDAESKLHMGDQVPAHERLQSKQGRL